MRTDLTLRMPQGFTLAEVLVALAVAGVAAAAAAPSLNGFMQRSVVQAQAESLRSALRLARQEAMARGETVTACALDGQARAQGRAACAPQGEDWSAGWLVFVDRGDRGAVDGADRVVSVAVAPQPSGSVIGTDRYLSFRPSGVLLSGMGHLRVLPPGAPAVDEPAPGSVLVCVNRTGRPRLTDTADCD
ncbi:GspH/FimT family pseudopilin [Ideonella sp.]|uniref:GspH/FimT family pseudopilin n=1 Tax=Ideonella sp. TaxID=1929293 RepID=UPI0035B267A4